MWEENMGQTFLLEELSVIMDYGLCKDKTP